MTSTDHAGGLGDGATSPKLERSRGAARRKAVTTRKNRTAGASWLLGAVLVAVLAAGCAKGTAGQPIVGQTPSAPQTSISASPSSADPTSADPTTTARPDWNPENRATETVEFGQTSVTVQVGERLRFADNDAVNFSVELSNAKFMTWYGDNRTFVGLAVGTTQLTLPNFNKHFDCPDGPCAHPNEPLMVTVNVVPGTRAAPMIAAPITLDPTAAHPTVRLKIGQQLRIPSRLQLVYDPPASGDYSAQGDVEFLGGEYDAPGVLVAAASGTLTFDLENDDDQTVFTVTAIISA